MLHVLLLPLLFASTCLSQKPNFDFSLASNLTNEMNNADTPMMQSLSAHLLLGNNNDDAFASFLDDEADFELSKQAAPKPKKKSPLKKEQIVYVDFNNGGTFEVPIEDEATGNFLGFLGPYESYFYTPEDQAAIIKRLEKDYEPYDIKFVTSEPDDGSEYSTLKFNDNKDTASGGPGSIALAKILEEVDDQISFLLLGFTALLGLADTIDFFNQNHSDNAGVDANLWRLFVLQDPTGAVLSSAIGIPLTPDEFPFEDAIRGAVLNQSANTGAHELGHIFGLRHHDSWGPIGKGLPDTGKPPSNNFYPKYIGKRGANESIYHVIASGASVGLPTFIRASFDSFFSERSAMKLALAEEDQENSKYFVHEDDLKRKFGPRQLPKLNFPNTIDFGQNAGTDEDLDLDVLVVSGRIDKLGEIDSFEFEVENNHKFFNAEAMSMGDRTANDRVWTRLRLVEKKKPHSLRHGTSSQQLAVNKRNLGALDPFLVDVNIEPGPHTTFVLRIDAPKEYSTGKAASLNPVPETFLTGDYHILIYTARKILVDNY